jgi:hypothetical protein
MMRRCPTKAVGWQKDLYRSPEPDEWEAQALEAQFFKAVDDAAARALEKLNVPGISKVEAPEAAAWSMFMHSLLLRTPEHLAATKATGEQIYRNLLATLPERFPGNPSVAHRYLAEVAPDVPKAAERRTLGVLPQVVANPKILDTFNRLHWMILQVPDNCPELLLSDNPLVRSNGLQTDRGYLGIPLSPRRLLMGTYLPELAAELRGRTSEALVHAMNLWTVESAMHFVVATDRQQEAFIRKHFGRDPKPTVMRTRSE